MIVASAIIWVVCSVACTFVFWRASDGSPHWWRAMVVPIGLGGPVSMLCLGAWIVFASALGD